MKKRFGRPNAADRARLKLSLVLRDGMRCWLCGALFTLENRPTLDHIIPCRAGGVSSQDNLRLACAPCNRERADDWCGEYEV